MAELQPIPSSRFYVSFSGIEQKMVKSVTETVFTGQTSGHEKPLASTKDGKTLWQSTSAGFEENPNITVEAYLVEGDMDWYNWLLATMPKSEGGKGEWSANRKDGSIVAYDSGDKEIMRWNLSKCWIKSYKVSDLSAESNELAVETFEIIAEEMVRAS